MLPRSWKLLGILMTFHIIKHLEISGGGRVQILWVVKPIPPAQLKHEIKNKGNEGQYMNGLNE